MTKEKGISLYPGHSSVKDACAYIEMAAHYGFTRAFTCLLSIDDKGELAEDFKKIVGFARDKGISVVADISPQVFSDLGISYDNLQYFYDMGATGVRLDLGFTGSEEATMTFNPFNLDIEINMSQYTHFIDVLASYEPNFSKLMGSHNFFPHRWSGLHREHFIKCTKDFQKHGLRTAAFVKAPSANIGPWPVSDGLCSLEEHRDLPLAPQVKDLFHNLNIATVLIAECFASEEPLKAMGAIDPYLLHFNAHINPKTPETEKSIITDELHFHRGDEGEYLIRSTMSRVKYKGHKFPVFNAPKEIKRGDILIESSEYGTYAGELHIARKDMPNSGRTNVVGHICKEELCLVDRLRPWQKFKILTV